MDKSPPATPKDRGRALRRETTPAEHRLWWELRNRGLGIKFRRQQSIGPYVVDFCCLEAMVVIEIDGGQHDEPENRLADQRRTQYLERLGYRVLRLWNSDVLADTASALEYIVNFLTKDPHPAL